MDSNRSTSLWVLLPVAAFQQTIMGGTFAFARYVLVLTDPFAVAMLRYFLASSILIPLALGMSRRKNARPIDKRDKLTIFILGLIIILFNQTLYLWGQSYTTASHAGLLFAMTPIFVYLLAIRYLGEKWSTLKGIGILLAIIGASIILFEKGLAFEHDMFVGDLIILFAVVAWAFYTVFGKPLVAKYGALRVTAYTIGSGTLVYAPFGIWRVAIADFSRVDTMGWISILYIGIATSVIGYFIWYWLLGRMEASRAAVLVNLQPVIAGILGFYFLSEVITLPFLIGGGVILAGVTTTQLAKSQ